jgi:hypothetical protein
MTPMNLHVPSGAMPPCDRRDRRSTDGHRGNWFGQFVDSGLAAPEGADRITRDLDRASLKRPGRGVPPPRSGPIPTRVRHETHHKI